MPRWICPYCTHLSTVAPIAVGHEFACPACKVESKVIDADAESISRLRNEKAAGEAGSAGLRSVMLSTIVLGGFFALAFLVAILQMTRHIQTGLIMFFALVLSVCVLSPLLEGVNELYRCRRLLEELVKKK